MIDLIPRDGAQCGVAEALERPFPPYTPFSGAARSEFSLAKRVLDVTVAVVGLVVLAPLLLVLAALVTLDSPGPAFFSQTRLGRDGRTFRMYKLRTMRLGADAEKPDLAHLNESEDARLFKIRGDPRVTRAGRRIRQWSLDELPQLYNVLVGEMSLVGPRPFFLEDLPAYEEHHMNRLLVKPGLTGLWQVSGRSDIVNFDEVVRLDQDYIQNWSLGLDLRIIGRTLPVVMRRRGAY